MFDHLIHCFKGRCQRRLDIVRARTQAAMNEKLKGYHVALARAHLQLVGGILTLNGLKVIQQAHPHPPTDRAAAVRAGS